MNTTTKPFLRWAGSKRQSVPRLSKLWSESFKRYIEPFAGSSCLYFNIKPSKAILSDVNHELMETYETLRDFPIELHRSMTALPRNKSTYYHERSKKPQSLSKFDRAVRFLYLNRNCFNGIYRTNKKGEFNVPFAGQRVASYPSVIDFINCSKLLKGAQIAACDFETTLEKTEKEDFVFIDPPYALSNRRMFSEYGPECGNFDLSDLGRLKNCMQSMEKRGSIFVVTYADCSEARSLAKGWNSKRWAVHRQVAGFSTNRRMSYELIITNSDGEL